MILILIAIIIEIAIFVICKKRKACSTDIGTITNQKTFRDVGVQTNDDFFEEYSLLPSENKSHDSSTANLGTCMDQKDELPPKTNVNDNAKSLKDNDANAKDSNYQEAADFENKPDPSVDVAKINDPKNVSLQEIHDEPVDISDYEESRMDNDNIEPESETVGGDVAKINDTKSARSHENHDQYVGFSSDYKKPWMNKDIGPKSETVSCDHQQQISNYPITDDSNFDWCNEASRSVTFQEAYDNRLNKLDNNVWESNNEYDDKNNHWLTKASMFGEELKNSTNNYYRIRNDRPQSKGKAPIYTSQRNNSQPQQCNQHYSSTSGNYYNGNNIGCTKCNSSKHLTIDCEIVLTKNLLMILRGSFGENFYNDYLKNNEFYK
ncbi:13470_t:CDS:1 [Entrophospora sp. SA101]|nr:13470_t:CDS:1 [Entrophospora sp. SA101]CAJ0844645.1 17120_t:CDS:1 [Entrophospora sp. SA101]CAJ0900927.1 2562_t:CDS:1 [Entrophospora sp. SA101]